MADRFPRVNAAAELALNSDSDESLLENESDVEDIDDMDISESSDTDDAPTMSQAAQSRRGGRRTQVRGRNNYVWCPATRQPQRIGFTGNTGPTALAEVSDPENFLEYF